MDIHDCLVRERKGLLQLYWACMAELQLEEYDPNEPWRSVPRLGVLTCLSLSALLIVVCLLFVVSCGDKRGVS